MWGDSNKNEEEKKQINEEEEQEEKEEKERVPVDRSKKNGFTIFGVNISELNNEVKNIIGYSLLILVFCVFIYGIRRAIKEMERPEKIKKKKKIGKKE